MQEEMKRYENANDDFMKTVEMLLWLADNAAKRYPKEKSEVKRQIIKTVLFNPTLEVGSLSTLHYSYRKPFNYIVEGAVSANWQTSCDALRTWLQEADLSELEDIPEDFLVKLGDESGSREAYKGA